MPLAPNLTALEVVYEPPDVSNTLPPGAYIQSQAVGTANGITDGVLGTVTVTKSESSTGTANYVVSADYSPVGASNFTVQAYLQGVLMAQAKDQNGSNLAAANIMPNGKDLGDIITPLSEEWPNQSALLTIGTASNVPCDRLVIIPENVPFVIVPTAFQIVASQVPALTIANENVSLVYQGLTNTALGTAAVSVACCVSNLGSAGQDGLALIISNLGSSGQDGVSIALPTNLTALDVHCQDINPSNTLPVGEYVRSKVIGPIGAAGTVTNGVLGTVTMTKVGTSNYQVTANFAALGRPTALCRPTSTGYWWGRGRPTRGQPTWHRIS